MNNLKKSLIPLFFLFSFVLTLSSCELVGDIFEAGLWVGVIIVVLIVGVILFVISKIRGK